MCSLVLPRFLPTFGQVFRERLKISLKLYSSAGAMSAVAVNTDLASRTAPVATGRVLKRYENILKSAEDARSYRGLLLANELKVLLISDPTTDKSAASMDVNIGYLCDPDDVPGLAHFCEHMLFMGTAQYPNENDYTKYLSEHGGMSNASTHLDHTNYYFDVVPEHFVGALDRFSQFFISPLFSESSTERELNAIHSEHGKNVLNDMWRADQLDKSLARPDHPYHKFGTGNRVTLETTPKEKGINVREKLLEFHNTYYSSNIMALALLGKESLDELEEIVANKFSGIANKNIESPTWPEPPYDDSRLRTYLYMVPIKDVRNLNILFPTPDLTMHYKSLPENYISNLIGHEGPGSLLSALKERGWSNKLVAGSRPAPRGTGFFGVTVDLTEAGMFHVDDIILLTFQYINMIKAERPLEWIQNEQKHIAAMTFNYKDRETPRLYTSALVHNLHEFPMEDILSAHFIMNEWKPDMVMSLLNDFVPKNVRVEVIAKKFAVETDQKEFWYGTDYKISKIPEETLKSWTNAGLCPDLRIPDKNDFIPQNFEIFKSSKTDAITDHPQIIKDTAITRVWFKQDDKFLLPKANLMFDFVSPLAYLDPMNCNLTYMFTALFKDALNQYAYSAELAGLKWDLSNTKYGLILAVGGFNDKQKVFLDKIMEKLVNFKIDRKRFEIFKESYVRSLNNFAAEQPYQHAVYYLAVLLTEHSWTKTELLDAVEHVTVELLEAYIPQLLSRMHIESMIHGNVTCEQALELIEGVEQRLASTVQMSPLLPRQLLLNRELRLDAGTSYLYEVRNDVHQSSCIEVYYQCGLQSRESNVMLELFAQIINEPCFDILRTKEQLGYIVFSGVRRTSGVQGLRIIVQSDRHPTYVDSRIEYFLLNMHDYISNMSTENFERHKEALAAQRLEKPKKLTVQSQIYWSEITSQQYHFDRSAVEVAHLRTLTKENVLEFYRNLLAVDAEQRHKIAVYVVSTACVDGNSVPADLTADGFVASVNDAANLRRIEDVTAFKSAHGMHPLVQPYMPIARKGNKCKL